MMELFHFFCKQVKTDEKDLRSLQGNISAREALARIAMRISGNLENTGLDEQITASGNVVDARHLFGGEANLSSPTVDTSPISHVKIISPQIAGKIPYDQDAI